MGTRKLNVYFPLNNLNPQGWVSEFITPVITRTGKNRSDEANLFYDTAFNQNNLNKLGKVYKNIDDYNNFLVNRANPAGDKLTFINGNFLDLLEVDSSYKGTQLSKEELIKYTLFMATIKPYQAAFLQPYMKLQYGYRKNKKEKFTFIDFPFTQFFDLDMILGPTKAKSEGCGIQNVTVDNKFNLATQINSNIKIKFMFSNLKLLTQEIDERRNPTEIKINKKKYPYGFSFTKLVANLNIDTEAIRLEYGKKVAPGFEEVAGADATVLKSIIERREKKVLLLNKTKHTFTFEPTGIVNLEVDYLNFHDASTFTENNVAVPIASPENIKDLNLIENYGNLLSSYSSLVEQAKSLEDKIKDAKKPEEATEVTKSTAKQKQDSIKDLTEKLNQTNKTLNSLKRSLKPSLTTVFLDKIKSQGQLFGVKFNTIKKDKKFNIKTDIFLVDPGSGDFIDFFNYEDEYDVDKLKSNSKVKELFKSNNPPSADQLTRIFGRIFNSPYDEEAGNKTYGQIMFFPLKSLIYAAYSFLSKDQQEQVPNIIFGNVLMKANDKIFSVNIGDLLIETETLQRWYYNNFFKKDKLEYSFGAFISDVIRDLVPEALYRNKVGFDNKAPTSAVKTIYYYLKSPIPPKLKQDLYINYDKDNFTKLAKYLDKNATDNAKNVIYYGQVNNQTTQVPSPLFSNLGISEFKFNETKDSEKGIPHIKIGADAGAVLSINFSAQDFPKIRTALAMEALADKASRYFFHYYQISLEMLGNNMFNYDGVICIPSTPLGIDSEENDPGIAGYYKVKGTTDKLDSNNNYYTTALADWVFNPKNANREKQKAAAAPVSDVIIRDHVNVSVNNPVTYIVELLENNADAIITSQLQKVTPPENKTSEEAKKDNSTSSDKNVENVDRQENIVSKNKKSKGKK